MATSSGATNSTSCFQNIEAINSPLEPYQTLALLVPGDDRVWTERNEAWMIVFKLIIIIVGIVYLMIGIASVLLIIRKKQLRISAKTFFAVYTCTAILGFSRALMLFLDPFGILGYIGNRFEAWIIFSRFLAALGFPSLVAACTLIIFTLFKLVNAAPGKQWYEYWKYVALITAVPYALALTAESIGHIHFYLALFSNLGCELIFVLWGVSVCSAYLLAGTRLLRALMKHYKKATKISESTSQSFTRTEARQFEDKYKKANKIKKKLTHITFGTAIAGILYAMSSLGLVVMIFFLILHECMGLRSRTSSDLWLGIVTTNHFTEILLALFVMYSITDVPQLFRLLRDFVTCKRGWNKTASTDNNNMMPSNTHLPQDEMSEGEERNMSHNTRTAQEEEQEIMVELEAGTLELQHDKETEALPTEVQLRSTGSKRQYTVHVTSDSSISSSESCTISDPRQKERKISSCSTVSGPTQKERKVSFQEFAGELAIQDELEGSLQKNGVRKTSWVEEIETLVSASPKHKVRKTSRAEALEDESLDITPVRRTKKMSRTEALKFDPFRLSDAVDTDVLGTIFSVSNSPPTEAYHHCNSRQRKLSTGGTSAPSVLGLRIATRKDVVAKKKPGKKEHHLMRHLKTSAATITAVAIAGAEENTPQSVLPSPPELLVQSLPTERCELDSPLLSPRQFLSPVPEERRETLSMRREHFPIPEEGREPSSILPERREPSPILRGTKDQQQTKLCRKGTI